MSGSVRICVGKRKGKEKEKEKKNKMKRIWKRKGKKKGEKKEKDRKRKRKWKGKRKGKERIHEKESKAGGKEGREKGMKKGNGAKQGRKGRRKVREEKVVVWSKLLSWILVSFWAGIRYETSTETTFQKKMVKDGQRKKRTTNPKSKGRKEGWRCKEKQKERTAKRKGRSRRFCKKPTSFFVFHCFFQDVFRYWAVKSDVKILSVAHM